MFSSKLKFGEFEFDGGFGSSVTYLEEAFKGFSGKEFNIAVSSATAAADMIFTWLSPIKIHVPTLTFCSPAMMALKNGHSVEVEDVNFGLQQSKTGELNMPVMYAGASCSDDHCLVLDAAHNPCTCHMRAKFIFTSFYPTKPLRCLNGGMISTDDGEAADYFFKYRNFGRNNQGQSYKVEQAGNKYYLDQFNASIVLSQLKEYAKTVQVRKANFEYLRDNVKGGYFAYHDDNSSYYFASLVMMEPLVERAKEKIKKEVGLSLPLHYPPLHEQPFFKNHPRAKLNKCGNAEAILPRLLNLPLGEYYDKTIYQGIVKCLRSL